MIINSYQWSPCKWVMNILSILEKAISRNIPFACAFKNWCCVPSPQSINHNLFEGVFRHIQETNYLIFLRKKKIQPFLSKVGTPEDVPRKITLKVFIYDN